MDPPIIFMKVRAAKPGVKSLEMACNTFFKFRTSGGLLVQMVASSDEVTAAAVEYVETTKRHHKAAPCVELLIAGPPPYEPNPEWETDSAEYQEWAADRAHWTPARTEAWARANLRFLEEALPDAQIYQAAWHQDENSPHCHLAFVPCDAANRISWRQLSAAAVGMKPPKGKTDKAQQAKIMSAWQDLYHTEVGEKFRLERGERGSTRKHEPLTDSKRAAAAEQRRIAQARAEILARLEAEKEAWVEVVRQLEENKVKEIDETRKAAYRLGVLAASASFVHKVDLPEDAEDAAAWLERIAKLENAEFERDEAGRSLAITRIEDPGDLVDAEELKAWQGRVTALTETLEPNNFSKFDAFAADDERVPGYSAKEWARKAQELEAKRLQAEMEDDSGAVSHGGHFNAADRGDELRGSADPQAGAADGPSSGIQPEETPE